MCIHKAKNAPQTKIDGKNRLASSIMEEPGANYESVNGMRMKFPDS